MAESAKQLPRSAKKVSSKPQTQPNFLLGQKGESIAVKFLSNKGYQILDVNFRVGIHEIDVVAFDHTTNELVFVEVKTRSEKFFGNPSGAVNFRKLRALRQSATIYRQQKRTFQNFRFDVIAVLPGSIEHYENVTW